MLVFKIRSFELEKKMKKIELVTENIIQKIISGIESASTIYILTAFVMKSGVELLKPHLEKAAKRGADIKICTGDYLYITQPEGLKKLIDIHKELEVRMWRSAWQHAHQVG